MRVKLVRRSRRKSFLYSIIGLIASGLLTLLVRYLNNRNGGNGAFEPFKMYVANNFRRKKSYSYENNPN